jgi:hypothetical protein
MVRALGACGGRRCGIHDASAHEHTLEGGHQRREGSVDARGTSDDQYVPARSDAGRSGANGFAETAPDAVPDDGGSEAATGRETEPGPLQIIGRETRHEKWMHVALARLLQRRELTRRPQHLRGSAHGEAERPTAGLDGQAAPPLCSPRGENTPPALGLHAGAETVLLRAVSLLGLVRLLRHQCL